MKTTMNFPKLRNLLTKKASGMPTQKDLNAVSPGAHAPRAEAPIAIPTQTYDPTAFGDNFQQRYENIKRTLRNKY